jgi:hypothetical protein
VVRRGDEALAILGIVGNHGGLGSPWLLATDDLALYSKRFLKDSYAEIQRVSKLYSRLENYVDSRNTKSIEWLKWCGFTVEQAEPYGLEGRLFHKFWMEA